MVEVNDHIVTITKSSWTEEQIDVAICNNMEFDGEKKMKADLKIVCREALLLYFKKYMGEFMKSPIYDQHRKIAFAKIKQAYAGLQDYFMANYAPKLNYTRSLYGHQNDVLATSMYRRCNLLALEQGLGKTITAASISKMYQIPRTIIICPNLVKWNWFRDMTDHWGYNKIYWTILDAKKNRSSMAFIERFCVLNYENVNKYMPYLLSKDVGHIILDECQYLKNHTSNRSKASFKLIEAFPKARITLLSGTPVTNRVNDMFSYLKISGHPLGQNYKKFISTYTISGSKGKISGSQNIDDLKDRISNFMIRKRTIDCVDLPPLIINNYIFQMEDHQDEYYRVLGELTGHAEELESESDEQKKNKLRISLKANLHTLNRLVAISKVKEITELTNSLLDLDKKVVIFSSYTQPLEMLQEIFKDSAVLINGSVDSMERDRRIEEFKHNPNVKVFLGNVKAAGVGINLVNSNDVIFTNFPFTPDDLEQPYKRLHRIGQKGSVNVYYTICENTIDEHVYNIIISKTRDINNLVDDNKEGVVHYDEIENKLFKELINQYKSKKSLTV